VSAPGEEANRPVLAPITIRSMLRADIERFLPYEDSLFGSEAWTGDSYRAELADFRYRHYVVAEQGAGPDADHDTRIVGWAGLMVIADTAQILTIGVVASEQRRGIGQSLLDVLMAEAKRRGAVEVILEVRVDNGAARRLYERNRFTPLRVRRGYYDLGRVDALEMKHEF
jgi:[ribosomal protein S18]-alanine N-acetyltransferase